MSNKFFPLYLVLCLLLTYIAINTFNTKKMEEENLSILTPDTSRFSVCVMTKIQEQAQQKNPTKAEDLQEIQRLCSDSN